jgi:hypothetical protein
MLKREIRYDDDYDDNNDGDDDHHFKKRTVAYHQERNLLETFYVCIPYFDSGVPFHNS